MRWEPPGPRDLQTPARTTRLARSNLVGVSGRHRPEMGINQRPLLQRQRAISGCPHITGRSGGGFCSVQLATKHNELSVCLHSPPTPPGIVLPRPPSTQSIHHTAPHHTTSSMFPRRTKVAASCGHEGIQHRSIGSEPSSTLYQHTRRPARGIARSVVTQRT